MAIVHRSVFRAAAAVLVMLTLMAGCGPDDAANVRRELTLATTTSTQDSGLLDVLIPAFEERTNIEVNVVAVGSGQALELARRGDADVLLTHAPNAEEQFMDEGWGQTRRAVMHNDFVVVGPANDPAKIRGLAFVTEAFTAIASEQALFVTRGDESGTHQKEKSIWKRANVAPNGDWYVEAGTSMANALRMAGEKRAYTLSDRATYLAHQKGLDLEVLVEGDELLLNRYSVITVHREKHPHLAHDEAEQLARFLVSRDGQRLINDFGREKYGQPLFVADGVPQ